MSEPFPLDKALHPDTLLAYEMNGEPLPAMHGYPLRLLVPGWYGMNSIKWLVGIKVIDHKFDGFYQTERYMVMNGPGADTFYTYLMRCVSNRSSPIPCQGRSWRWAHTASQGLPGRARRKSCVSRSARMAGRPGRMPSSRHGPTIPGIAGNSPGSRHGRQLCLDVAATNNQGETQPLEFPNQWDGRSYGNNMVFSHPVEVRGIAGR